MTSCRVAFAGHMPALPQEMFLDGRLISRGWDIEAADQEHFLALNQRGGSTPWSLLRPGVAEVRFGGTSARLSFFLQRAAVNPLSVDRTQNLIGAQDLHLQDFVARFRFPRDVFPHVLIAGRTLRHEGKNVWYQFAVDRLVLVGERQRASLRGRYSGESANFRLECYARDAPGDDWVVHFRLMPTDEGRLWLRWDTRFGRMLDVRNQRCLKLLAGTLLGRQLWYLAERRGGRPNLQLMKLGLLEAGKKLELSVALHLELPEGPDVDI